MEMEGNRRLAVTQQQAWNALNDPEVLKVCIPGCDRLEATGENQYVVGIVVRIGPVGAKFNGRIVLTDVRPPHSYTLTFDGNGGAAGFGKGISRVALSATLAGAGCELSYKVNAQVGGKIAQVGQRLVDGVARSMAEDFFKRLDDEMRQRFPPTHGSVDSAAETPPPETARPVNKLRLAPWVWAVPAAIAGVLAWLVLR